MNSVHFINLSISKKFALVIILVFFVWGGISYYWYVCDIKGFCSKQTTHIKIGLMNKVQITTDTNNEQL